MNKTPSHATMQRLFKGSIMVSTLVLLRATFRTYFDAHTLDSFNISIYICPKKKKNQFMAFYLCPFYIRKYSIKKI